MVVEFGKPDQVAAVTDAIESARESAYRAQSRNNIKQIMLAFHIYHNKHKHFPAARVLGPDGKHFHSWRVAILPYIDQEALFDE
jgi:hypothetical protein